jgi:hypothetical protein
MCCERERGGEEEREEKEVNIIWMDTV